MHSSPINKHELYAISPVSKNKKHSFSDSPPFILFSTTSGIPDSIGIACLKDKTYQLSSIP